MSHGSGPKSPAPVKTPVTVEPSKEKSVGDEFERLKKARSRSLSQTANTGLLKMEPTTSKNILSDRLG